MKRTIILFMTTILLMIPINSFAATITVGLKYGSSAAFSYTLTSDKGFYVGTMDGEEFEPLLPISAYTSISLISANGIVNLYGADGNLLMQDFGDHIIASIDYDSGGTVYVENRPYRGGFIVSVNSSGTMNLINVLALDEYVYGVLNAEMNHSNPLEALKAQAVTARSFATANLDRHAQYGFDLCASTHCQVYGGYDAEYTETNLAADETAGLCIYSEGKPVSAYYFKNSGGYTQNAEDVWGGRLSYLKAVEDPYSPVYKWNASFTFDELKSRLDSSGNGIGTITRVEIVSRNDSGAVKMLRFVGTSGSAEFSGEAVRSLLGTSVIRSTHFSFAGYQTETGSIGNTGSTLWTSMLQKISILGIDAAAAVKEGETVSVIGESGGIVQKKTSGLFFTDGNKTGKIGESGDNSGKENGNTQLDTTVEYVTQSPVMFTGLGYGHGVGMPQDSAIEMAKQGFTFDKILEYYYTGIQIQ